MTWTFSWNVILRRDMKLIQIPIVLGDVLVRYVVLPKNYSECCLNSSKNDFRLLEPLRNCATNDENRPCWNDDDIVDTFCYINCSHKNACQYFRGQFNSLFKLCARSSGYLIQFLREIIQSLYSYSHVCVYGSVIHLYLRLWKILLWLELIPR